MRYFQMAQQLQYIAKTWGPEDTSVARTFLQLAEGDRLTLHKLQDLYEALVRYHVRAPKADFALILCTKVRWDALFFAHGLLYLPWDIKPVRVLRDVLRVVFNHESARSVLWSYRISKQLQLMIKTASRQLRDAPLPTQ